MNAINSIQKDYLHHAYVIKGGESDAELIKTHLGLDPLVNTFIYERYSSLTIPDIRTLKERSIEYAPQGGKKLIFIETSSITREAEHALLKLLEEPTHDTHFFFLLPRVDGLLPTLLSRVFVVEGEGKKNVTKDVNAFLKQTIPERLAYIKTLIQKHSKDEDGRELKEQATLLVEGIISTLHNKKDASIKTNAGVIFELSKMRDFLLMRGTSPKIMLEYVALIV